MAKHSLPDVFLGAERRDYGTPRGRAALWKVKMATDARYDAWGGLWAKGKDLYCLQTEAAKGPDQELILPSCHFYRADTREEAENLVREAWPNLQLKRTFTASQKKRQPKAQAVFSADARPSAHKLVTYMLVLTKLNSKEKLGALLGINPATISRWLSGKGAITDSNILNMHETLNLPVAYIRSLSGLTRKEN